MKRNSFTPTPTCNNARKSKLVWGVTLIELLMVVVIIAILATIMYPRFQTFRIRARLKEVPNTIQLILAGEKYYYGKVGGYFPWTYGQDPSDDLNISLPSADSMCEYQVIDPGTGEEIQFRRRTSAENVGKYVISTDTYDIDADYDKYLGYLE